MDCNFRIDFLKMSKCFVVATNNDTRLGFSKGVCFCSYEVYSIYHDVAHFTKTTKIVKQLIGYAV